MTGGSAYGVSTRFRTDEAADPPPMVDAALRLPVTEARLRTSGVHYDELT